MVDYELLMEKLNNENYKYWAIRMKALLMFEECWDVIEAEEPQDKNKEWIKKNSNALFRIVFHVEDAQLNHIKKCETAKQAWESLKLQHVQPMTLGKRIRLFKKLFHTKLQSKDEIENRIYQIFECIDDLKDLGHLVDNGLKTAIIIDTINEYEQLGSSVNDVTTLVDKLKISKDSPKCSKKNSTQSQYSSYKCYNCNELGHISKDCDRKDSFLLKL